MPGWDQFPPDVQARIGRLRTALLALSTSYAAQMEGEMKRQAPWDNITANARNGLYARAIEQPENTFSIEAGHGVFYGIFLETRRRNIRQVQLPGQSPDRWGAGGPWTMIVRPTMASWWPRYRQSARDLVRGALSGRG